MTAKESPDNVTGFPGYAAYPPVVESCTIEGYLHELSNIEHSRDIGRPFSLFGEHYVLFGDTFCKNKAGDFVGVANNTAAQVPLPAWPLLTKYLEYEENEMVKPFIPLTEGEKEFEKMPGGGRVCLWTFGGVVEMEDGTGRVWYDKSVERNQVMEYVGECAVVFASRVRHNLGQDTLCPSLTSHVHLSRAEADFQNT